MSDAEREDSERRLPEPEKVKAREEVPSRSAERVEPSDAKRHPAKPGVLMPARARKKGGLQRAIGFVRTVAPVVQKVLPLLDGNVASVVSNILAPRLEAPRVNLEPIENAMTKMRKEHLDLRMNVADQTAALKRVADQVEKVKDATERNALEQKGLTQELQSLQAKVNLVAWVGLGLLAISILVNVLLFLRIQTLAH